MIRIKQISTFLRKNNKVSILLAPHTGQPMGKIELNIKMFLFLVFLSLTLFLISIGFLVYYSFFFKIDQEIYKKNINYYRTFKDYKTLLEMGFFEKEKLEDFLKEFYKITWDKDVSRYETFLLDSGIQRESYPFQNRDYTYFNELYFEFLELNADLSYIRELFNSPFNFSYTTSNIYYNIPQGKPLAPGIGFVTSIFGQRIDPFGLVNIGEFHGGIDFAAIEGTPIFATAPGKVILNNIDSYSGLGNSIKIHHLNGYYSIYGHCSKILVNTDEYVKRGQLIGLVGATGKATGSHVHYEVHIGADESMDPTDYINLE